MSDELVVAGVNGTEGSNMAVRAAVHAARERRCALRLVTAYGYAETVDPDLSVIRAARHEARAWLTRAVEIVRRLRPELPVTADVVAGEVMPVLERESKSCSLLVVGSRQLHRVGSVVKASVGTRLAATSHCPTMVILGAGVNDATAPVLAGVDGSAATAGVIRFALAEAHRRGRPLRLVSCLGNMPRLPPAADTARSRAELSRSIADLLEHLRPARPAQPSTTVEIELADAVETLAARSHAAALIVVGRQGAGRRPDTDSTSLGSVSSRLLHHARCPVVVVPPS
ncbi:MAG TPA: universal stress protein [Jatrophihabitans sp.]|nr:universal stress protein [Jatrophihabitans sp.]